MRKKQIKYLMYLIPIIGVFLAIIFTYYRHYKNATQILESGYINNISLIEQSIYNETKYTEMISKITEEDIYHQMEEHSKFLIETYKEDPNVLEWDLNQMKSQASDMEIYILDNKLEIIASTLENEVGLDFSKYGDYSNTLKERLEGDTFESDAINFSIIHGELTKYSYMPTPDHRYLLELSVRIQDLHPQLKDLNIVYLSKDLQDSYPFIEDIRVYKFNKTKQFTEELGMVNEKPSQYTESDKDQYVQKAIEANEVQEKTFKDEKGITYRVKYIPYISESMKKDTVWWESYVIEIVYNDEVIRNQIDIMKKMFLQSVGIISFLYMGSTLMVIWLLDHNDKIAHQDYLTKLPNRKYLEELMKCKLSQAERKKTKIAVLFFDLDKFKEINDTLGHSMGDQVLQKVASLIKNNMPKDSIVARLGGDEFVGVVAEINKGDLVELGEQVAAIFRSTITINSQEISIQASIGISLYPDHGDTVNELILKADDAMYLAKSSKEKYKIYKKN